MEDASRHVSTHRAPITVSAVKASVCTQMVELVSVSTKEKDLQHLWKLFSIYSSPHRIFPTLIIQDFLQSFVIKQIKYSF